MKTFFDVVANIGYYSILGCQINPNLKAYAFERYTNPSSFVKLFLIKLKRT
jgi:hypothetical protein